MSPLGLVLWSLSADDGDGGGIFWSLIEFLGRPNISLGF
jgi:hypothetical protein